MRVTEILGGEGNIIFLPLDMLRRVGYRVICLSYQEISCGGI